jgi:hypothetical protein
MANISTSAWSQVMYAYCSREENWSP